MDILIIILLSLGIVAAVAAMILSRRKGKCASCPYYDSCPRLNCDDLKKEGDEQDEGPA